MFAAHLPLLALFFKRADLVCLCLAPGLARPEASGLVPPSCPVCPQAVRMAALVSRLAGCATWGPEGKLAMLEIQLLPCGDLSATEVGGLVCLPLPLPSLR